MSEQFESVKEAVEMIQSRDIVIFLWSHWTSDRQFFFNILAGTTGSAPEYRFHAHRIKHPRSGDSVTLISAPCLGWSDILDNETGQGLRDLLTLIDKMDIRCHSVHIWVHDVTRSRHLPISDELKSWYRFKGILGDVVEIGRVAFLATYREEVGLGMGQGRELAIRSALGEDARKGLTFGRLPVAASDEEWCVIDEVVKRERKRHEDRRVQCLQVEIDELHTELERTQNGKVVLEKLKKTAVDQEKYMVPLLKQLNSEDLKPEEKTDLEKKIEDEYMLCLRHFRGHFAEIRQMRVEIGPHLREFYGLLEPKRKKVLGMI